MVKLKEFLCNLRSFDVKIFFQLLIQAITILAFLTAINYFSKNISTEIILRNDPQHQSTIKIDAITGFYEMNSLVIPQAIKQDAKFKAWLTSNNKKKQRVPSYVTDIDMIKAIKKQYKFSKKLLDARIDFVKEQLRKYTYDKRGSITSNILITYLDGKSILDRNKNKLSKEDTYIFLCALLSSREVVNDIYVKNDGDIDIRNVKLIIISPMGRIFESRNNNIKSIKAIGPFQYTVEKEIDRANIYFPYIKQGETICLQVVTKENLLNKEDILIFYEKHNILNTRQIWIHGAVLFSVMLLLAIFFNGKEKKA